MIVCGAVCRGTINNRQVNFFVNNENDVIQRHHRLGQFYEHEEIKIICQNFDRGEIFVDIGANVGNHTIFMGLFHRPARIIVIEPNPHAATILDINIKLNELGNIVDQSLLGLGFSKKLSNATLYTPNANNLGRTMLVESQSEYSVVTVPRDIVLASHVVNFIKIDVEGMEMSVLSGLHETISRCRPRIFVEVDNVNVPDFESWLIENKYTIKGRYRRYAGNENYMLAPIL